jgi:hypothetical protein
MAFKSCLEDLALATGTWNPRQIRLMTCMFTQYNRLECRKTALSSAWIYLFSDVGNDRWQLAKTLAGALNSFDAAGYRRVKLGYRPALGLETYLVPLLDNPGPRCVERLYQELRELTVPCE